MDEDTGTVQLKLPYGQEELSFNNFSPVCSKRLEPADSGEEPDFLSTKTNEALNIKKAHNCLLPKENGVWHMLYENIAIAIV